MHLVSVYILNVSNVYYRKLFLGINLDTKRNNPGVDFTKLFCQAQSCWSTVFGKKFGVQFHQRLCDWDSRSKLGWNLLNAIPKEDVKFCARNICAQMLIKSTLGVNFSNFLRAAYAYESFARSFFVLAVKVKLFICRRILAQLRQ
jgi:hypothetical protein